MQKIEDSITKSYLPVKIYIDQIEEIANLFKENNIEYTLQTDHYKYDSFSELINSSKETTIKMLKINTHSPYISIELNKRWANLYTSSNKTFTAGIFYKIDKILTDSRRFLSFFYSYYFIFSANIIIFLSNLLSKKWQLYPEYIDNTLNIIWFLWLIKIIYVRYNHHALIQLVKKGNAPNFFQRKKDDLILALVSGSIGAILGAIITKYVH